MPTGEHQTEREYQLNQRKLRLETKSLARQLTRGYQRLELFKIFAAPLSVLVGVAVTIFVGVSQLNESRQLREDERFERAVTRLAALTPSERLAGLAGLQLYLQPGDTSRHRATVHFMADALASEHDPVVRGALLESLSELSRKDINQEILNDALMRVRDRNRDLFSEFRSRFEAELKNGRSLQRGDDEVGIGSVSNEELALLHATASALTALVRNGARIKDLSGIYCESCDFSGKILDMTRSDFSSVSDFSRASKSDSEDLSGIDFHNAILKNANFIGVTLHGASFDSADIIHANFSGADLSDAKFTDSAHREFVIQSALIAGHLYAALFPDFTCADLIGADFTASPFFGVYRNRPNAVFAAYPILHNANIAKAKLGVMKVFVAVPPARDKQLPLDLEHFRLKVPEGLALIQISRLRTGLKNRT